MAHREPDEAIEIGEIPMISEAELKLVVDSLKSRKVPGPDGIPTEALKATVRACAQLLLDMYNGCLKQGHFYKQWKVQRLVLISKGKSDLNTASAYRPLCMLDTARKVLEKITRPRLQSAIQAAGGLSDRQYGFRPGLSTIDAVRTVVKIAEQAQKGNHYSHKICVAAALDVRNAFNSLRWEDDLNTLRDRFRVPGYLLRIMQSYLSDLVLLYDTIEGRRTKVVTAGAAQGSVLGSDIWNIDYDKILGLR